MKHNIENVVGWELGALDGEIGKIKEFYFEDQTWTIRYLIVETGNWLLGRKVLISPEAVVRLDFKNEMLEVKLTKEQIENSPDINSDKPVSRQHEDELYQYYGIGNYWMGSLWSGGMGTSGMMRTTNLPLEDEIRKSTLEEDESEKNTHLRSTHSLNGYHVKSAGNEIGEVDDFIFDDSNWKIDFVIVKAGGWFSEKKILIQASVVKEINWKTSSINITATTDELKNNSAYDAEKYFQNNEI